MISRGFKVWWQKTYALAAGGAHNPRACPPPPLPLRKGPGVQGRPGRATEPEIQSVDPGDSGN